ncbi:MAG TPA: hypothetical protein VMY36_03750 [Patescibacteria group bacterium]|nr:hypothetical protein [Patescibacteria group bacterium]
MAKKKSQFEKDIESVIRFLKQTDPEKATRANAIEMLGSMQTLAHLIAHKVVDKERGEKLRKEIKKRKK